MKLKGTLGGIALLLTVSVFYTFAFCMVQDVDDDAILTGLIGETEYASAETAPFEADTDAGEFSFEDTMDTWGFTVPNGYFMGEDMEAEDISDSENGSVKDDALPASEEISGSADTSDMSGTSGTVTEAPVTETTAAKTTVTAYEEPQEDSEELNDGSTEAQEKEVYGAYTVYDDADLEEEENIDELPPETEAPAETTVTAAASKKKKETEKNTYGDNEVVINLFGETGEGGEAETVTEEIKPSVSVSTGGKDISTNETFTAKINGSVQTVNAYDLVCWIVNNEMSTSFSDEALKAQAVAAYSYMKYHNVNGLTPTVLVKKNASDRVKDLVSEVWGVCCYYNGSVAQTVYMASSSGYTADAEHVWGGKVPYLKSVYCPFDIDNDPNYGSKMKVSEDKMRNMLESCLGITLTGNPRNWLTILEYTDGNYVYELSVDGQKKISGRKLRENVMGGSLKSAAFDVYYSNGYFHFTTYGYGHGVGMSQNGANILAKRGYTYTEILKYYFTGIEII